MTNKKNIPFESIEQRLAIMGYDWHSSEYFISPDKDYHSDPVKSPFRPNFYGLTLCVKGWLDVTINDKHLVAHPYCFFAMSPHTIIQRGEQSPHCIGRVLLFTKEFLLKNIISVLQLESFIFFSKDAKAYIHLKKEDAKPLLQLYNILKNKRGNVNTPYQLEIIRSLFFTYLYEAAAIFQKDNAVPHPKYTRDADLNLKFQGLLAQYSKERHDLKFYADSLFITPKYLIHAIKMASGKTPGELIDEAIVAQAKMLLKDTTDSIASVAEQLHFSDQASFGKFFKKHTGFAPMTFRREG